MIMKHTESIQKCMDGKIIELILHIFYALLNAPSYYIYAT
jgi:hypothetical protein